MDKTLIVIVGPTGIGKTNLGIQLATHFNCEIISADSRQFYKEMRIGTAVPSADELRQVKHHCIQHRSIKETYTVGDFEKESLDIIRSLFEQHNFVVVVGGSGLYIDAVTKGLDNFPEIDPTVRQQLQQQYQTDGLETLQEQLKILDPTHYKNIDLQNPQRVIRALEVCIGTGKPYSSFLTKPEKNRPFRVVKIGLQADRQIIYDRINQRVELMMAEGLLQEAKKLYSYRSLNALNTVGYKEIFNHLDGEWELDFAISEIKKNTRRFAKRQLTWFRKDTNITWFDYQNDIQSIIGFIKKETV